MQIIIHRVNTIDQLLKIPKKFGVEIDVRQSNGKLILSHTAFTTGDSLEKYLTHFNHAGIIFDIKEAGIEEKVIALAKKHSIKNYFLLDVEVPYLYNASRRGFRYLAVRYSEVEPIETLTYYKNKIDWVWIDTISKLPVHKKNVYKFRDFKTCLVSPERWGRPQDIQKYKNRLALLKFKLDAVMTEFEYASLW